LRTAIAAEAEIGNETRFSWLIIGLLFFATTINYIDRAIFGILSPTLQARFLWSEVEYSRMVMAFQLTYAIGYAVAGRLLDRIGVRMGFPLVVGVWSLAAVAHGLVAYILPGSRVTWAVAGGSTSAAVVAFGAARAMLGLAEGGNFPAAMKTIGEWFPREQRAFATGLFNSGSNFGAVACPLLVPTICALWNWQGAFYATGAIGFAWLLAWWKLYPRGPHPNADRDRVRTSTQDAVPWMRLLTFRQTWTFIAGMVGSSPVWWFYIFWGPKFLNRHFHLDLQGSSLPLVWIFLGSGCGGVASGWMTTRLLRRGWSVNAARKTAMLGCALAALPVCAVPRMSTLWAAVALITLAAAGHCGFAANLFSLINDLFPASMAGAIAGIGGMASSLAAIVFAEVAGQLLKVDGSNYQVLFDVCAATYVTALAIMHILSPALAPIGRERELRVKRTKET
jgi:MFS transporter, ACS family, hexuronate transporter